MKWRSSEGEQSMWMVGYIGFVLRDVRRTEGPGAVGMEIYAGML